jgi:hypothetical protein
MGKLYTADRFVTTGGTTAQYVTGAGTLVTFPTMPTNQIQVCSASGTHIAIDSTNLISNSGIVYNYNISGSTFYETGILTVVWSSDYGASQVVRSGQVTIGLNTEISFSVGLLANSIILYLDSSAPFTGPYNITLTKNVLLSCGGSTTTTTTVASETFNITTESNDPIITENGDFIVTN